VNAEEEAEVLSTLTERIRREIRSGFSSAAEIAETAGESCEETDDPVFVQAHARRLTRALLEAHRRDEATWPDVTDCDRVDAAFEALEADGIVCRQNFSCCQTCGSAEIADEVAAEREAGGEVAGYAYYHMQDTDSAVDGGGLHLAYGSVADEEAPTVAIAQRIVSALEREGLAVNWNGEVRTRIHVPLVWRRRSPLRYETSAASPAQRLAPASAPRPTQSRYGDPPAPNGYRERTAAVLKWVGAALAFAVAVWGVVRVLTR
jgi:hypothetical protein